MLRHNRLILEAAMHKGTGKLKKIVGIGGIHCYCCAWGNGVSKRLWNRTIRKLVRAEVRREFKRYLEAVVMDAPNFVRLNYQELAALKAILVNIVEDDEPGAVPLTTIEKLALGKITKMMGLMEKKRNAQR